MRLLTLQNTSSQCDSVAKKAKSESGGQKQGKKDKKTQLNENSVVIAHVTVQSGHFEVIW